jgi:hypothetical protein
MFFPPVSRPPIESRLLICGLDTPSAVASGYSTTGVENELQVFALDPSELQNKIGSIHVARRLKTGLEIVR